MDVAQFQRRNALAYWRRWGMRSLWSMRRCSGAHGAVYLWGDTVSAALPSLSEERRCGVSVFHCSPPDVCPTHCAPHLRTLRPLRTSHAPGSTLHRLCSALPAPRHHHLATAPARIRRNVTRNPSIHEGNESLRSLGGKRVVFDGAVTGVVSGEILAQRRRNDVVFA
jgi:hypothetical protein